MAESNVINLNLEIDSFGQSQFQQYKNAHPEDEDLEIVKIDKDFCVEKKILLKNVKENGLACELPIMEFKDDEKSLLLKPCIAYVTGETEFTLEFYLKTPTCKKLTSCFLAAIKGYEPGKVTFDEKDAGSLTEPNAFTFNIDKKPEFKDKTQIHWPCQVSKLVADNDDFVLLRVDIKQNDRGGCMLTVTYGLWNTQIITYVVNKTHNLFSHLDKLDFDPEEEDFVVLKFCTPKLYKSWEFYKNKLQLLAASYGEK